MGYRGEDASRSPAAWGEQPPRRPAAGSGAGGTGSWGDGSQGQWQDDYPAGGYDEYARHDEHDGYGQQGYEGYGSDAQSQYGGTAGYSDGYQGSPGYGGTAGYGQGNGYGEGNGYGQGTGYGEGNGYGQADGYGYQQSDGYAAGYGQPNGYGSAGGAAQSGYGDGYRPAGGTGGHLALPSGATDSGGFAQSGGYSGNDWYEGQPQAASGSGFADTGTYQLNSRIIDDYGTGPRQAQRDPARGYPPAPGSAASGPLALPQTGQQERYDEYGSYPGYGQDDQAEQHGYGASGGYRQPADVDDYPGYGESSGFAGRGYDDYAGDDRGGYGQDSYGQDTGYDDYAEPGGYRQPDSYSDPYEESGQQRGGGGQSGAGTARSGRGGKRTLLLATFAVLGVLAIAGALYKFVLKPGNSTANQAMQPLPTTGPSASTPACVAQFGTYCHIETRTDDPTPLSLTELFPPAFTNEQDHAGFQLVATKVDKTCSAAVYGQTLMDAMTKGNCTQVLRASYMSADGKIMGTIGVVNLGTTHEAHIAGKVVGESDFVAPLAASKGKGSKIGQGTGVVESEYKGHYLILTWAEYVNGTTPSTTARKQQLEQWEADLVAGTVNISLSQRMVNGAPAAPPPSSPSASTSASAGASSTSTKTSG